MLHNGSNHRIGAIRQGETKNQGSLGPKPVTDKSVNIGLLSVLSTRVEIGINCLAPISLPAFSLREHLK